MDSVLLSSKKMDYCTPQDFFDELDAEFVFALDAAATDKSAKCNRYFTPETDGLKQPWDVPPGYAVFCNPPYGRQIGAQTGDKAEDGKTFDEEKKTPEKGAEEE